jgi:SAM-dependent methyltransferase
MQGLDIGCGKGHIAALLSRIGLKMNGLDLPITIGEPMWISDSEWQKPIWDMLHKQDGPVFQFGDGRKLPFPDNSFDFVIAYAVIEHITPQSDIPTFLSEIRRVLKPNGYVLFADAPRRLSYTEKLSGKLGFGEHDNKYHEKELDDIINQKLKVVDHQVYDMLPAHPPGRLLFQIYNLLFPITKLIDTLLRNTPLKRFAHHNRVIAQKAN